jgi:hypothetical protein
VLPCDERVGIEKPLVNKVGGPSGPRIADLENSREISMHPQLLFAFLVRAIHVHRGTTPPESTDVFIFLQHFVRNLGVLQKQRKEMD